MTDSTSKPAPGEIIHEEGWALHSSFGVLKTNTGTKLARLEDVHAWLMRAKGIPSASAAARVFSVFTSDAGSALGLKHGAARVRSFLHVTDLSEYPDSVQSFAGRQFMDEAAEWMPYVPHHHFEKGTKEAVIYALGVLAGEVWAPHSGDMDLNDRLDGYCPEGYFPSAERSRAMLGRLAVPFAMAHALWGWGTVARPAVVAAPASPFLLADFAALVAYRKTQKATNAAAGKPGKNIPWGDGKQLDVLHAEYTRLGATTAAAESMGKSLGCTRQAVESALNKKWTPVVADPFRGISAA